MTEYARYTADNESVVEMGSLVRTSAKRSLGCSANSTLLPRAPEILIVEDDSELAIRLMNALEDWETAKFQGQCKVHIATTIDRARSSLSDDTVDIYVVDLILDDTQPDRRLGAELIAEIVARTNAGIIILTTLGEDDAKATELLRQGADDYIRKPADSDYVRARIEALWRRIQYVRPSTRSLHTHNSREFLLGNWRFAIGSRFLSRSDGESLRLSPTEHAFLRHLCVNDMHECDVATFNIEVLGRKSHEDHMRVDNLVYRLRNKLGANLELVANDGKYRLLQVSEVTSIHRRTAPSGSVET